MPEQSDVDLIRGVTQRDRRAFETLYCRHAASLRRYLVRLLRHQEAADEALNDVMLVIWQKAVRFDPSISRPTTWFLAIAHNVALKVFDRRRVRSAEVSFDTPNIEPTVTGDGSDPATDPSDQNTPERALLGREVGRLLDDALGMLSAEHRTVIELTFGQGRSYEEIASVTGVCVNTVKTRVFYARRHLAEILRRHGVLDSPVQKTTHSR